jgi:biopolymer transport protein ExbD
MKLSRSPSTPFGALHIVPLVNVLFLAAILAGLASRFSFNPGIHVVLPPSPFPLSPTSNPVILHITNSPAPSIFLNEKSVPPDQLDAALRDLRPSDRSIVIHGDRSAPNDLILRSAQTALQNGFRVAIAGSAPLDKNRPSTIR